MAAITPIADVDLYRRERRRLFAHVGGRWPGTIPDPYELLDLYALDPSEISAITRAAAAITRIYRRVAELLRKCPSETYQQMGLPPELQTAVRTTIPGLADTVLGRLDLVRAPGGFQLLEFNTDVPGMVVESFCVNRLVCEDAGERDANEGQESVLARGPERAIDCALNHLGISRGLRPARVAFAAAGTSSRDADIARYLAGLIRVPESIDTRACAIQELQADEEGLYDAAGTRIDVLFRIYPLAVFPYTPLRAHGGGPSVTLMRLLDLVDRRRLVLINPASAGLLNSKAVQAIIWNLHESGQFFDATERTLIGEHFLPTYMDPVFGDRPHVIKPVCGSQGDTVQVVNTHHGATPFKSAGTTYTDQPMVYQKYVELPRIRRMTEDGPRDLHVVASCFVVNGEPAGVCFRAGGLITDESAWYLPVCVAR